jgi:acetyltransferase-like isoleucine patch superfamily enzyme
MSIPDIDDRLRAAVTRIIRRGIRLSRKTGRTITLARSSSAAPVDIRLLDPDTPEGAARLSRELAGRRNYYSFAGLGELSEKNRIHWTALNRPLIRRIATSLLVFGAMMLRAGRLKNRLYRLAGVALGPNTEVMQGAWLDHFCPELIVIGDRCMIGAFCKLSTHAYEGGGRIRIGLIRIADGVMLSSGVALGAIRIGEGARVLPNTTLSPYFARLHPGSVVGFSPPPVKTPEDASRL